MIFPTELLVFLSFILGFIYIWLKYKGSYWKRTNVPYIPSTPLLGNLINSLLMRETTMTNFEKLYNHELAKNEPFVGIHIFHKPGLLIREPELIKRVLVKDFNYFQNRYSSSDAHSDAVGAYTLFFSNNPLWKQIRNKLTPVFTSGKMKQMFPLVDEIGLNLEDYLKNLPFDSKTNSICKETKEICALYTTDVISSIALGIKLDSINDPNSEFRRNGKKMMELNNWYRGLEFMSAFFLPQIISIFGFKVFSNDATNYFRKSLHHIMNEREKSGVQRNDLIDVLISLSNSSQKNNNNNENNLKFEGDVLVAQAAAFFAAGFETSSSTMSFTLFEISRRPDIQDTLRNEIKQALENNDGKLTYDLINNMQYLNQVVQEVLRLYPPLPFLDRECILNERESGYSLEPYSKFKIPNTMPIYIPVYSIQRDEKYFPNPNCFDPDRFSPENKDNIQPYTYMPFGLGPRNCIGERFGLLQAKMGLVHFLKDYYVRPSDKTKELKFDKRALLIQAEDGIYLNIIKDQLL